MFKLVTIFLVAFYPSLSSQNSKKESHTKGEVWPKLQEQKREDHYYVFPGMELPIIIDEQSCPLLVESVNRLKERLGILYKFASPDALEKTHLNAGMVERIVIKLTKPCNEKPELDMDEFYRIHVSTTITVISESLWGIMRGLESLVQMFYIDDRMMVINGNHIKDFPKYSHRGIMLDTSWHYISADTIKMILDAMAINKFNVFHWHIVDDESFPYESGLFPELSEKGVSNPELVYNATTIRSIIKYAKNLGIRVIPELNIPGHTRSIEKSHPELMAMCYTDKHPVALGPMIPLGKSTDNFLQHLLLEFQLLFPDEYIHLGGSGINVSCWASNPIVQKHRLFENDYIPDADLPVVFFNRLVDNLLNGNNNIKTKAILWQDILEHPSKEHLKTDLFTIQIYKNPPPDNLNNLGNKLLYSTPWDLTDPKNTFSMLYASAPHEKQFDNLIGGEVLLWGRKYDEQNIIQSLFVRACAVAEVLWNPKKVKSEGKISNSVYKRIQEHTNRMIKFGIPAQGVSKPKNEVSD